MVVGVLVADVGSLCARGGAHGVDLRDLPCVKMGEGGNRMVLVKNELIFFEVGMFELEGLGYGGHMIAVFTHRQKNLYIKQLGMGFQLQMLCGKLLGFFII